MAGPRKTKREHQPSAARALVHNLHVGDNERGWVAPATIVGVLGLLIAIGAWLVPIVPGTFVTIRGKGHASENASENQSEPATKSIGGQFRSVKVGLDPNSQIRPGEVKVGEPLKIRIAVDISGAVDDQSRRCWMTYNLYKKGEDESIAHNTDGQYDCSDFYLSGGAPDPGRYQLVVHMGTDALDATVAEVSFKAT